MAEIFGLRPSYRPEAGAFLARIEWELKDFQIPVLKLLELFQIWRRKFQIRYQVFLSDHVPKIAIFASKLPQLSG